MSQLVSDVGSKMDPSLQVVLERLKELKLNIKASQ
jgi:hypothetical protein